MPNTTQSQIEMTPEEAKASLGIATHLQDQLMPRQMQEMAPPEPQKPLRDQYPQEDPNKANLDEIKNEIKDLKVEIEKALKENDNGEEESSSPAEEAE